MDLFTNPDLFRYINEYTDLRSLCDTCSVFATLKQYIHYKLNEKYSFMYYDDISFRNIILSKICTPYKQLHLDLRYYNITNVSALANVHTLNLRCSNITDVSALGKIHNLNLQCCRNIRDVSALGKVHTLNLSSNNNINVSALGNVHNLDLSWCKNITGVSELGNVHTLKLTHCNITDLEISALQNVPVLNL